MFGISFLAALPAWLEAIVLIGAALGALAVIYKMVIKPAKRFLNEVERGMRSLNGYDAVLDPASGTELKPPTPPLSQRVETLEDAVHRLITTQESILTISQRVFDLEQWRTQHESFSEAKWQEITAADIEWKKEHEAVHLLAHEVGQEVKKNT